MKERGQIFDIPREKILLGPIKAIFQEKVREYCLLPYPGHSQGCPNYGSELCPPNAPLFPDLYKSQVYLAAIKFDFNQYLTLRREKFPETSERGLRNVIYYQGHLRAELSKFAESLLKRSESNHFEAVFNPEAMGLNFCMMFPQAGLRWQFPPQKFVYKVAVLAKRK